MEAGRHGPEHFNCPLNRLNLGEMCSTISGTKQWSIWSSSWNRVWNCSSWCSGASSVYSCCRRLRLVSEVVQGPFHWAATACSLVLSWNVFVMLFQLFWVGLKSLMFHKCHSRLTTDLLVSTLSKNPTWIQMTDSNVRTFVFGALMTLEHYLKNGASCWYAVLC